MEGLPAETMMNFAPRASIPFTRSSDSVRSMTGDSGPADTCPPRNPSQIETFDPTMNFESLIAFAIPS